MIARFSGTSTPDRLVGSIPLTVKIKRWSSTMTSTSSPTESHRFSANLGDMNKAFGSLAMEKISGSSSPSSENNREALMFWLLKFWIPIMSTPRIRSDSPGTCRRSLDLSCFDTDVSTNARTSRTGANSTGFCCRLFLIPLNQETGNRPPCASKVKSTCPVTVSVNPLNPFTAALLAMRIERKDATPKATIAIKMAD